MGIRKNVVTKRQIGNFAGASKCAQSAMVVSFKGHHNARAENVRQKAEEEQMESSRLDNFLDCIIEGIISSTQLTSKPSDFAQTPPS